MPPWNSLPLCLEPNAPAMDARLRARLTRPEAFALALAFGSLAIFLWLDQTLPYIPFDYHVFIKTASGDLRQYYYADWLLPLFYLLAQPPPLVGFALWSILNTLAVFFAARLFGGNAALSLLTFQFFYCLFLGQINGLVAAALALAWWALAHRRWHLAGLAFWLAAAKFQLGLPFGLILWLAGTPDWRSRLRVLFLPFLLTVLTFLAFPDWIFHLLARIESVAPYDWGSLSLWRLLGPAALLLLLPPLLLPMPPARRSLALLACVPLVMPYFQSADLLVLFALPVGWLPLALGNLGFLFFAWQFSVLRCLWIAPLFIYLAILVVACRHWFIVGRKRGKT